MDEIGLKFHLSYATRFFLETPPVLIHVVNFNMADRSKNLDENGNQFANSLIQRGHRVINHVFNLDTFKKKFLEESIIFYSLDYFVIFRH